MKIGTVKWFNLRKGYGFIHPDDGGRNIFVHMSAVEIAGMNDLKEGQRVIFEIQRDERTGCVSGIVESGCVRNDTVSRWPFRHHESVRYHFCLHLIDNVGSVSV